MAVTGSEDEVRSTIEQMVRHVQNFETNDLSLSVGRDLVTHDHVTPRELFIELLAWICARGTHGWKTPMRIPDYPWATELRRVVATHEAFVKVFQIRGDCLYFHPDLAGEEVQWADSYVYEHYRSILMR